MKQKSAARPKERKETQQRVGVLNKVPVAEPASPADVLAAAQKAPRVFSIGAYYHPIYVMREKGHTWRYLAEWLQQFNIKISHVHLHRLYQAEEARLTQLTREELEAMGMPEAMIAETLQKADHSRRIPSVDPEALDETEAEK